MCVNVTKLRCLKINMLKDFSADIILNFKIFFKYA